MRQLVRNVKESIRIAQSIGWMSALRAPMRIWRMARNDYCNCWQCYMSKRIKLLER